MSKRGLGKGLDALLSTSAIAREKATPTTDSNVSQTSASGDMQDIAVEKLQPGVYQPRTEMDEEALSELSASIRSQGIIQPIVVRQVDNAKYEIIAGERRWRAAKLAGLTQVPCVVKRVQDKAAIAMALIENIQRENLNAVEEAHALESLRTKFELSHQQIAEVIGKSRAAVSNLLRLNQLENDVKKLVSDGSLDMGHARALLALDGEQQVELALLAVKKQLTVRQTEQLVKKTLQPPTKTDEKIIDQEAVSLSQILSKKLGNDVSLIRNKSGTAKLTISIDEPHKLEQLIAKLERIV
ncbi:chromosome partitioning protein ParB [Vibrio sp. UCD-FRSSP16_10]|uniref:ParB/RepB/Spo0J family partition protein n=1 Tax=unclassified Vibrio TaxID=2614977 RepID=UPI0007FC083B|nr:MULTISPECIES: ParB/RepB/Spo0J family partition protein [unclassified Vibrio]OBT15620.1 chromosome partitioning protein ParB [Vibrio sp. UCD-FRSSP16_30]OBT21030.1 chromosome partitioning protein ParB [Vibrio sp. UCD-FRSSP16_10]